MQLSRVLSAVRSFAFVFLGALAMAIGAERFFWFWSPEVTVHLEVAGYYMIASGTGFLLMRRYRVNSLWSLLLVCPLVAYAVEGVLTPILYSGGPFVPFFPAWFTFWHGVMSFLLLVVVVRRWLLVGATGRLAAGAVGLGAFWAVWASTLWLPENVEDEELVGELGSLHVLDPGEFAIYAATFTAVFMAAHFCLGFVWPASTDAPARFRGATIGEWLVGVLVGIGVIAWTVVVPWALPMFVAYAWIQIAALRWHRRCVVADPQAAPDLLDQLRGRVRVATLAPLALMAPTAAAGYGIIWQLEPTDVVLRVVMYSIIAVQAAAGLVVSVVAIVRARRRVSRPVVSRRPVSV